MLSRFLRLTSTGALLLILALAVVSQFWVLDLRTPAGMYWPQARGIMLIFSGTDWSLSPHRLSSWSADDLLRRPRLFTTGAGVTEVFLPWWLLLINAATIAAAVQYLTRKHTPRAPFPVQPAARLMVSLTRTAIGGIHFVASLEGPCTIATTHLAQILPTAPGARRLTAAATP